VKSRSKRSIHGPSAAAVGILHTSPGLEPIGCCSHSATTCKGRATRCAARGAARLRIAIGAVLMGGPARYARGAETLSQDVYFRSRSNVMPGWSPFERHSYRPGSRRGIDSRNAIAFRARVARSRRKSAKSRGFLASGTLVWRLLRACYRTAEPTAKRSALYSEKFPRPRRGIGR
jgi:hypothetical protein